MTDQSLPSWERGLKLDVATGNSKTAEVAPLVGAWIEIGFRLYLSCSIGVAPLVGAWIEMMLSPKRFPEPVVAPLVGAWIEICMSRYLSRHRQVAPLVGAWIEILELKSSCASSMSLPSWERGLK